MLLYLVRFQHLRENLVATDIASVKKKERRKKHDHRSRKLPNSTVNTICDFIKYL